MKTARYIIGSLFAIVGIGWITNGLIISGIFCLLFGISVMPVLQQILEKAAPQKKKLISIVAPLVLFILVIVFAAVDVNRKEAEQLANDKTAENLLAEASAYFEAEKLDSSEAVANRAALLYGDPTDNKAVTFVNSLKYYQSDSLIRDTFINMSADEFKKLEEGTLAATYIEVPSINKAYINKLSTKKEIWHNYQKEFAEEKKRAAKEAEELAAAEKILKASIRKNFAQKLRNVFLDSGMDIQVEVKGKNSDQLYLMYPLFNDVWMRKFEKEGLFDQWHEMGFNRIDLDDNYNYHKYHYWE